MSDLSKWLGMDPNSGPQPPQMAQLDPRTQEMIKGQADRALRPTSEFAGDLNKNLEQRMGQIGQFGNTSQAQTGMSPGMFEAMRNVYGAQTADALGRIKTQNELKAEQMKAGELKQAAQYALQQQQTKVNHFQVLTDSYNQMEAQRAQFVSSLCGLAGTGLGSYRGAKSKDVSPGLSPDQVVDSYNSGDNMSIGGGRNDLMFNAPAPNMNREQYYS